MANIDMSEAIKLSEKDEFWAIRGKAIQAYANLEQAAAQLFAIVAGTTQEVAVTILFRIASADSRNKILDRLFKKKFQDRYNLFRNSLFEQLRPVDLERNEIVHWNAVCVLGHDGIKTTAVVKLAPPAFITMRPAPLKTTDDLRYFISKCDFYSGLLEKFALLQHAEFKDPLPEDEQKTWLEIFSQPIVYPPPSVHPLFPSPKELDGHIQAFFV